MYRRDRAKPPRATSQSNRRWEEKKSEPVSGVYTVRERPFRAYKKNVPFGPLLTMLSRLDFNPPRRAVNIPASGPRESESRFLPIRFLLLFYFFCFFLTLLVLFFFGLQQPLYLAPASGCIYEWWSIIFTITTGFTQWVKRTLFLLSRFQGTLLGFLGPTVSVRVCVLLSGAPSPSIRRPIDGSRVVAIELRSQMALFESLVCGYRMWAQAPLAKSSSRYRACVECKWRATSCTRCVDWTKRHPSSLSVFCVYSEAIDSHLWVEKKLIKSEWV